MEKRRSNRKVVNIQAQLTSSDRTHNVFIQNFSKEGLYLVTTPLNQEADFNSEEIHELKFNLPSGEVINLNCKLIWSYKTPPHGITISIGMEVINPPPEYEAFIKS
ncbi:MAG: PilZ domain-containing protein [Candidatus Hodarchaeales archaeon]|jgi:hypothetical protein